MQRKSGFTLIELLVVIAIIAILAALLFPVFSEAKKRGQMTTCLDNLRQLSFAFQQYRSDFSDTMPKLSSTMAGSPPDWCGSPWVGQQVNPKDGQLWKYVRNYSVYLCPVDWKRPVDFLPANQQFNLSYSVNYRLDRIRFDACVGKKPSQILFIIHEARETINDGYYAYESGWDRQSKVHYDGTTVCYCDGHGHYYSWPELDKQKRDGRWAF